MKIFSLNADEWDRTEEREGWRFKDAWVGAHTGAELIGASMYEVEPGNKQGPFHTHHANEEWAIVLRGEIIEYLDTGKVLAKDIEDENIMFARPGPTVEYWEGEDQ